MLSEVMIGAARRAGRTLRARRDLEDVAQDLVARGQQAWPRIKLSSTEFVEHVARRIDDADDVGAALEELHAADLWLAYACGKGNRAAIGELDRQLGSLVPLALARMKDKVSAEDVGQLLREKLLVSKQGGAAPKILEYSGRGPLGGWMRIAAVRTALSIARRGDAAGMQPVTREVLLALPTTAADPEMDHLRKRYARDFKKAFESALAELGAEDRNVLRLSLVDGLSIDEIGVVFGVHRATAARHLVRAKETLQTRTREILADRLNLGRTELRSIMGYIQSHLELSIQRLLTPKSLAEGARSSAKANTGKQKVKPRKAKPKARRSKKTTKKAHRS